MRHAQARSYRAVVDVQPAQVVLPARDAVYHARFPLRRRLGCALRRPAGRPDDHHASGDPLGLCFDRPHLHDRRARARHVRAARDRVHGPAAQHPHHHSLRWHRDRGVPRRRQHADRLQVGSRSTQGRPPIAPLPPVPHPDEIVGNGLLAVRPRPIPSDFDWRQFTRGRRRPLSDCPQSEFHEERPISDCRQPELDQNCPISTGGSSSEVVDDLVPTAGSRAGASSPFGARSYGGKQEHTPRTDRPARSRRAPT